MQTTEHPKTVPQGYRWRKIGGTDHADYQVSYWRNNGPTKRAGETSLTAARKTALALLREDSATYVEIYRYAESGVSIIPVIQVEYGV